MRALRLMARTLAGGATMAILACDILGECTNTEQARITAPDGRRDAVSFVRGCGATTDNSTQVALVPSNAPIPNRAGNVFIDAHPVEVQLHRLGSDTLEVRHSSPEPHRLETQVEGVAIVYRGITP